MEYSWAKAIAEPAKEFESDSLELLEGAIPKDLNGTLYRNGPAALSHGEEKMSHWFDGDGAILAVKFNEGKASAKYKYV